MELTWNEVAVDLENGKYKFIIIPTDFRNITEKQGKKLPCKQVFCMTFADILNQQQCKSFIDVPDFGKLVTNITDVWKKNVFVVDNINRDIDMKAAEVIGKVVADDKRVQSVVYNINLNDIQLTDNMFSGYNPKNTIFNFILHYKECIETTISLSLIHNLDIVSNIANKFTCVYTLSNKLNKDWFFNRYSIDDSLVCTL